MSITVTQASHGFAVKDWIGFSGSSWAKVTATSGQARASAVVVSVPSTDVFAAIPVGPATLASHGYTLGPLYLSQSTAGAATSTAPTTGISQRVGVAIDASTVLVEQLEQQIL